MISVFSIVTLCTNLMSIVYNDRTWKKKYIIICFGLIIILMFDRTLNNDNTFFKDIIGNVKASGRNKI